MCGVDGVRVCTCEQRHDDQTRTIHTKNKNVCVCVCVFAHCKNLHASGCVRMHVCGAVPCVHVQVALFAAFGHKFFFFLRQQ